MVNGKWVKARAVRPLYYSLFPISYFRITA